jgi:hypothetical protein
MGERKAVSQEELNREARELLRRLGLMEMVREVGEAWLVGSVPLKLIVKPDIDVHVLVGGEERRSGPDAPEVAAAMAIARNLMERCGVHKLEVLRFLFRSAVKIGFDSRVGSRTWHVDVWVTTDRENLGTGPTRWVQRRLTPALRQAILKLKRYYAARDMCKFGMSGGLYRAVIEAGVRTPRQFLEYARTHALNYSDVLRMLEADARTWKRAARRRARR